MISVTTLFEKVVSNDMFAPGVKYKPVGGHGYPDPNLSGHDSPQEMQRQDNEAELQAAETRKELAKQRQTPKNPTAIAALEKAKMERGGV